MLFTLTIIVFGLTFCIASLLNWYRVPPDNSWRYIHLLYALVGLYWAAVYSFIALAPVDMWQNTTWSYLYIRLAKLLTLAILASGAIQGARRKNGNGHIEEK